MRHFLACLVILGVVSQVWGACSFYHSNLKEKQPLFLMPEGPPDPRGFVRVDSNGLTTMQAGETMRVVCPGENNYMVGGEAPPVSEVTATCVSGTTFNITGHSVSLSLLECFQWPYHTAHDTKVPCRENGSTILLGFPLENTFITLTEICFDHQSLTPHSSTSYVVPGKRSVRYSSVFNAYFHGTVIPSVQYTQATQGKTFAHILGAEKASKLITKDNYLVTGFLTNKEDFVYWPQQYAQYYYINTVPMWKKFNTVHWKAIENAIRDISYLQGDVMTITETYNIQTYPDVQNISRPLYLFAEGNVRSIPVPDVLAKIVFNQKGEGVVFLNIVNQSEVTARRVNKICDDICGQIGLLQLSEHHNVLCCRPEDPQLLRFIPSLASTLKSLPKF